MKKQENRADLEAIKKIAKETNNKELVTEVKERMKNRNTVEKW